MYLVNLTFIFFRTSSYSIDVLLVFRNFLPVPEFNKRKKISSLIGNSRMVGYNRYQFNCRTDWSDRYLSILITAL